METFTYGGKALTTTAAPNGDLLIEGFCAVFQGLDRQKEQFAPGSFARAIKTFLAGSASLCYHHKAELLLGKVLSLVEIPGVGVKMRARVDGAIRSHPTLGVVYQQIKRGSLTGLSTGGFFKRALTGGGRRITDLDITEISARLSGFLATRSFQLSKARL